jgi:hypothetical protein
VTTPVVNTAQWIIRSARRDAGWLGKAQEPTSEDYAEGLARLNEMVNLWQTQGLKLFLNEDLPITLTAGTASYTLGPAGTVVMTKPMRVVDAYYSDANGIRRPLIPMAWSDYIRLSQITQQGQINSYFVDKQPTQLNVFFWLVPDSVAALGTAHLIIQRQAQNFTMLTDTSSFPQEWAIALRWGLADELAGGQPASIMDRCERRAKTYRTMLEDWDVEDAPTKFQPDSQMFYSAGNFS